MAVSEFFTGSYNLDKAKSFRLADYFIGLLSIFMMAFLFFSPTESFAQTIDFGNDSGGDAKNGECNDPRFVGDMSYSSISDENVMTDATDCAQAFKAKRVRLTRVEGQSSTEECAAIEFGYDAMLDPHSWSMVKDGVCNDPRFTGKGVYSVLFPDDIARDATDCRAACMSGTAWLREVPEKQDPNKIDFGDNSSTLGSNDGSCDDPRFVADFVHNVISNFELKRDAADCEAAYAAGYVGLTRVRGEASVSECAAIDFGDDSMEIDHWNNNGKCDDPRFAGEWVSFSLHEQNIMSDATDCRVACTSGMAWLRVNPNTADAKKPMFGDDTSVYAHDGFCDDMRFIGDETAGTFFPNDEFGSRSLYEFNRGHDATDCAEAFEAGKVRLARDKSEAKLAECTSIDFGDDPYMPDDSCTDARFFSMGSFGLNTLEFVYVRRDATDCRAACIAGTAWLR